MRMCRFLCVILLFSSSLSSAAEVYRGVDEDGNPVFSDRPLPGADKLKLTPAPSLPALPLPPVTEPPQASPAEKAQAKPYTALSVSQPLNDSVVRNNAGNVMVQASLKPALQTAFGHVMEVVVDGRAYGKPVASTNMELKNLNRGSHTVQVKVLEGVSGRVLRSSPPVVFHLKRFSSRF